MSAGSAVTVVASIHRERVKLVKQGKWPEHSLRTWRAIAKHAAERPDGVSPSPTEQMALDVVAAEGKRR